MIVDGRRSVFPAFHRQLINESIDNLSANRQPYVLKVTYISVLGDADILDCDASTYRSLRMPSDGSQTVCVLCVDPEMFT